MKKNILFYAVCFLAICGCKEKSEPVALKPKIGIIQPESGLAGTEVAILGENFNVDTTGLSIMLDGQKVKITFVSSGVITFNIPLDSPLGDKKITITQGDYLHSKFQFIVHSLPQLAKVEPDSVLIGERVKISFLHIDSEAKRKLTAWIGDKKIEALFSEDDLYIFPSELGPYTVKLKVDDHEIKVPPITVFDPYQLITAHSWVIAKTDIHLYLNGITTIYNYNGKVGEFIFNKDGTYTRAENGVTSTGYWGIEKNPSYDSGSGSEYYNKRYLIKFQEKNSDTKPIIKLTMDSLIFEYGNCRYKLIPTSKVPIFQEIPDLPFTDILTRPKLWILYFPKGQPSFSYLMGSTISFLPDGTFLSYDLSSNKINKGKWLVKNVLGKPELKLIWDDDPAYVFQRACIEISFYKLELKDANCYYVPRYW